ncbi:DUF433 domain-containing protein [Halosimplex pelagicum]|uniref:DUF433 domain-containing protein n=1 Tax=Halosimplex pelagicum TaxID=869886 RepID=A0A7D5P849_9EURY|nr:DUF433 domain-containing protein [Halosimplex pelagicum]QLH83186.1 DUF433 domain-containing protein [Halosimplex pelagicum]
MSTAVRIVKTADVLHGKPRIEGTRVGVFQIGEAVRRQDWSEGDAAEQFGLDVAQVRAAVEYYDEHPELMDTLRKQKRARRQSIRAESRAK